MPFLLPNQQHQSSEGKSIQIDILITGMWANAQRDGRPT